MMTKTSRQAMGILIVLSAILGCLGLPVALAAEQAGQVTRVQGTGSNQSNGRPAREGQPVKVQDVLATDASNSKLLMTGTAPDDSNVSLGQSSVFGVATLEQQGATVTLVGQVTQGIVRFIKQLPETNPPSSYTVYSPTAFATVSPGNEAADFVVSVINETVRP